MRRWLVLSSLFLFVTLSAFAQNRDFYFERPQILVPADSRYVEVLSSGDRLELFYQEVDSGEGSRGRTRLRYRWSETGRQWSSPVTLGPDWIDYFGEPPKIYSVATDGQDNVFAMVQSAGSPREFRFYSRNNNADFVQEGAIPRTNTQSNPGIYALGDQFFFAYYDRIISPINQIPIIALFVQRSDDLRTWTDPTIVHGDNPAVAINLPTNGSFALLDGEIHLVYQDRFSNTGGLPTNQLIHQKSSDGGVSWSDARIITQGSTEQLTRDQAIPFDPRVAQLYDNQRPELRSDGQRLTLTWERRYRTGSYRATWAPLSSEGVLEEVPYELSVGDQNAFDPRSFSFGGEEYVSWFTNPETGNDVRLAKFVDGNWVLQSFPDIAGVTFAARPIIHRERFHLFAETKARVDTETFRIVYVEPDQRALAPRLTALNFTEGVRDNQDLVRIGLSDPGDVSGYVGFNYLWSQDPDAVPEQQAQYVGTRLDLELPARDDGQWYLRAVALDRAGNWSEPATLPYFLDLTPPERVRIARFPTDEDGFLASNSFSIDWLEVDDPDLAGYTWEFRYLGDPYRFDIRDPGPSDQFGFFVRDEQSVSRTNIDDGTYALYVSAIDGVGNIGEPARVILRLNKYIPFTLVSGVDIDFDIMGNAQMELLGKGYRANGSITRIILDRDGIAPYDFSFAEGRDYRVVNDRIIRGLNFNVLNSGDYTVLLDHSERGSYRYPRPISFQANGVVKIGEYVAFEPRELSLDGGGLELNSTTLLMMLLAMAAFTVIIGSGRQLVAVRRDARTLERDIHLLLEGKLIDGNERREALKRMRRRGIGLRVKFTLFFVVLILVSVLVIAIPLTNFIFSSQQQTLAQGLLDRTQVLMDSINLSAADTMDDAQNRVLELNPIVNQYQALDEATYATITGYSSLSDDQQIPDTVISTTDPLLLDDPQTLLGGNEDPVLNRRIVIPGFDTITAENYQEAEQLFDDNNTLDIAVIQDSLTAAIAQLTPQLEAEAQELLEGLNVQIRDLTQAQRLAIADFVGALDPQARDDARARADEAEASLRALQDNAFNIVTELSGDLRVFPPFDPENFDTSTTNYLFYKPIFYLNPDLDPRDGDVRYLKGFTRINIDTTNIVREITSTQQTALTIIAIFAAIALGAGLIFALVVSSIIVIPINKLVKGVEQVRDTDNKEDLSGFQLDIKTGDELNLLSNVIQQMVSGLVTAAKASKDLSVGKEVQKMFIPLDPGRDGKPSTTGSVQTEHADFFGYYEGAKGVSGDYFYYENIAPELYAMVKCDVAGKGVPASLIMVEVATLFLNFFKDWGAKEIEKKRLSRLTGKPYSNKGILEELVTSINDLVAERQFSGRFAAFIIVLLNTKTGEMRMCHAGDNQVHIYRKSQRSMEMLTLGETPAAGVFTSDFIPPNRLFKEESTVLNPGDMLMLFTDGIEEAQRQLRDETFQTEAVTAQDIAGGLVPESYIEGTEHEEISIERIHQIIEAVKSKGEFRLSKLKSPIPGEELIFDYSGTEGTIEDAVMALIAFEKVFRLLPDPSATIDDRIKVDRKVDDFLSRHFVQYRDYFTHKMDEDPRSEYLVFSHLKEDEQYDDLTVLGIMKK